MRMRGLNMEYYLPIMVMVLIQSLYAGLTLGIRIVLLEGMSPMVFVVYRYAFATIVLAPIAYLSGITLDQNLLAEGLYLVSSSVTSVMCNVVPAVTFVIAAFVGMEKVNIPSLRTIAKILGTIICVSGAVCIALLKGPKLLNAQNVVPPKSIMGTTLGNDENWLLGCLILFGSCVAWSVWLILQGVMGSAVALCLQAWCISKRGPVFSAMFTPVCTIIVTVLAALLLHEEIYIGSLIGGIGVIIGLYIVLWGKAEDVMIDVIEKTIPKSMVNETKEIVDNKSCEKAYCKVDLEEPLLSQ
ncbi:hypothetical protein TSUD_352170 [Trifolium subterraneum]|nr:hypothetical protein TSUD_352170 [Trifolium subterraneum]